MSVRVRFAPSPTGMFHVGGARSALFNWAVARRSGGTFVLRIEDTDAARNRPEWTTQIIESLAWIGIHADDPHFEGPVFQSDRGERHRAVALQFFDGGHAYYCDCTAETIAARRPEGGRQGYDGFCRDRGLAYEPGRALRFRTPDDGVTTVVDAVRGTVEFPNEALEDFVVARGDGSVTFLLANAVDDIDGGINQVIRGEEHLSNAPKQQLMWQAVGAEAPVWAHVPVIVNEKRQKLSKRRDKVALADYQDEGYLAEAIVNYLMLLGWAPADDREILPWSELEAEFDLAKVSASPAFFDVKKLRAFNGEYIRALPVEEFTAACAAWLAAPAAPWAPEAFDAEVFAALAPLVQSRVGVLSEVTAMVDFAFLDEPLMDEASWAKAMGTDAAAPLLRSVWEAMAELDWTADALKTLVEQVGAAHELKLGKAQAPVRVAVTGRTVGLPLFESMEILGRERTRARLERALGMLSA